MRIAETGIEESSDRVAGRTLGERLFFDPILSSNGEVSCATCHDPARGYSSGGLAPRMGGGLLARRAPSLLDRGDARYLFWDGRATSLEDQAREVISNPREMGGSYEGATQRVRAKYGNIDIARELAAFERTLSSPRSRWDDYREGKNRLALTEAEARGWDLFRGKAECYKCHTGRLLTDESFHNTGISNEAGFRGLPGMFKTPGLRGVKLTGPYMHDASLRNLEDVIEHYNRGGGETKPLRLAPDEKADLVTFLKSL